MKNTLTFIKSVYITGVILDGIWAVILAFPSLYKVVTQNPALEVSSLMRVVFIIASSLMLGWTLLLYWGWRKPIERRFILLLTAFPVVFGIFVGTLFGYCNGSSIAIVFTIKTVLLMILLTVAFVKAKKISGLS